MACYKIYKKNNVPLCKNTHTYINGTNKAVSKYHYKGHTGKERKQHCHC